MPKHAKYSPSAAHRWIACPGSIRLSESIEYEPSEYAQEGTILHKITEQCLRSKSDPVEYLGTVHSTGETDFELTIDEEHVEAVNLSITIVKEIMQEYNIRQGKLEVKTNITENLWGTVDVMFWNSEYLIVIDFKFGRGKSVEAEGNAQMMLYSLGALKELNSTNVPIPDKLLLVIIQPRVPPAKRVWETTPHEVKTWYEKSVLPAIEEAENGNAVCNPGEVQCQFCPANGVCTARANYLLGIAEEEFQDYAINKDESLPVVQTDISEKLKTSLSFGNELITPEIAGKILSYQDDFDNFFKRVGEYALKTALSGTKINGFKLVYGRSNRKWTLSDAEMVALLENTFEAEEPYSKKVWSPAQAEKKIGKGKLDEYIHKPKGKVILALESDTREEVDDSIQKEMEEFKTLESETVTGNDVEVFEDSDSIDDILSNLENEPEDTKQKMSDIILTSDVQASPPDKRTKKHQLMLMGLKGGVALQAAADSLYKGNVKNVEAGLRNLNSRDGYTIILHTDQTFTVKE